MIQAIKNWFTKKPIQKYVEPTPEQLIYEHYLHKVIKHQNQFPQVKGFPYPDIEMKEKEYNFLLTGLLKLFPNEVEKFGIENTIQFRFPNTATFIKRKL